MKFPYIKIFETQYNPKLVVGQEVFSPFLIDATLFYFEGKAFIDDIIVTQDIFTKSYKVYLSIYND